MYVPKVSTLAVQSDIRRAYALAAEHKEAPRDAWLLQCVQEDRSNPKPCTKEDKEKWGEDGTLNPYDDSGSKQVLVQKDGRGMGPTGGGSDTTTTGGGGDVDDDLLKQMMNAGSTTTGGTSTGSDTATGSETSTGSTGAKDDDMDDLFKKMMAADGGAP